MCIPLLSRYLVTYSPHEHEEGEPKKLITWDIRTGLEKRTFYPETPATWPILRWSHDDRYFARLGEDALSVYETPVSIFSVGFSFV